LVSFPITTWLTQTQKNMKLRQKILKLTFSKFNRPQEAQVKIAKYGFCG
jgi:hypothetical protein